MKKTSEKFLVASSLVAFLIFPSHSNAHDLRIEGKVRFEDGENIRGATIVLTQLSGFFFSKPKPLGTRVTDAHGKFEATIEDAKGSISVRLVGDRCAWTPASELVDVQEARKLGMANIELVPRRDECE